MPLSHRPSRAPAWLRLPLFLLPAHVRAEHERELDELLELERATNGAPARLWLSLAFDALRAAPGAHWDVLRQDLLLAGRQLKRAPGFAAVAILTLAAGIGGNAALFSLVDGVLLRPMPFREAERLVDLTEENPGQGFRRFGISPANFRDISGDSAIYQVAAAYYPWSGTVRVGDHPDRATLARVEGTFFQVFTDPPLLGRALSPDDDVADGRSVVVSYSFWTGSLGGDPNVVGRALEIDGAIHRIVGVMPPRFRFPTADMTLWKPLGHSPQDWQTRGARYLSAVGRLRPGVSIERAVAAASNRAAGLAKTYAATNTGWTAVVRDLQAAAVGSARTPLLLVWAAGALVLLIAVANVANLLLGRAVARQAELALRGALGARSGRLARQLLTEGLVLAAAGGVLGLGIAALVLRRLTEFGPTALPRWQEVSLGGRVVAFTVGLVLLTTLMFSALPALSARQLGLGQLLREGRGGPDNRRNRWQAFLVATEVALAVFVLVGSSLVIRTLARLLDQPLGFAPESVTTFRTEPPWRVDLSGPMDTVIARMNTDRARAGEGFETLRARLGALPGVQAVGAVSRLALTGNYWVTSADIADHPAPSPEARLAPHIRVVTPGYFEAVGTRILRGRGILPTDLAGGARVAVIDETLARRGWGNEDPIGRDLLLFGGPNQPLFHVRVVGVVEPVYMSQLDTGFRPAFYVPFTQAIEGHYLNWGMDFVIRGGNRAITLPVIQTAVRAVFPDAAIFRLASMDQLVSASVADRRFQLLVLGTFGGTALALTMVGVGGVLLLSVRRRRRELGVRLALGAEPERLWWLVQREGLMLVGAGTVIGLVLALAAARVFASLVYGISVRDPVAFAAGPLLLAVAAFLAAAVPAFRAMRIDPMLILREE